MPDRTTLSRRDGMKQVEQRADEGGRLDLAVDSTGLLLAKPSGAGHEGW